MTKEFNHQDFERACEIASSLSDHKASKAHELDFLIMYQQIIEKQKVDAEQFHAFYSSKN